MASQFALYAPLLRQLGFKKQWDSRSGGLRVAEWKREEPDGRTLDIQIWEGGSHRVSHEWCGCTNTAPTSFSTVPEMKLAIRIETIRMDNRYADPNNHSVPTKRAFLRKKRKEFNAMQKEANK